MSTILTPEIVDRARELRANGVGWHTVSKRTGVSAYLLRVEIESEFLEHHRAVHNRHIARKKTEKIKRDRRRTPNAKRRKPAPHVVTAADRIPPDVAREREQREAALERRTLSEMLCGDPPKGWRALDQRARR